jgi:hypothetical protein
VRLLGCATLALAGCIVPLPAPLTPGNITFVQNADNGASANSFTFSSPSTAGNAVVVTLLWGPDTAPIPVVSDDHSNLYPFAVGPTSETGASPSHAGAIAVAGRILADGTPLTIQITSAGQTYLEAAAAEYSGGLAQQWVDVTGSASSLSTTHMTASVTTTSANDLLVGWAVSVNHVTAGQGFNSRDTVNGDVLEDGPAAAPGQYSVSATSLGTTWLMQVVALRAAPQ